MRSANRCGSSGGRPSRFTPGVLPPGGGAPAAPGGISATWRPVRFSRSCRSHWRSTAPTFTHPAQSRSILPSGQAMCCWGLGFRQRSAGWRAAGPRHFGLSWRPHWPGFSLKPVGSGFGPGRISTCCTPLRWRQPASACGTAGAAGGLHSAQPLQPHWQRRWRFWGCGPITAPVLSGCCLFWGWPCLAAHSGPARHRPCLYWPGARCFTAATSRTGRCLPACCCPPP